MNPLFAALFIFCFVYTVVDLVRRLNQIDRHKEDPHRWHAHPR